LFRWLAQHRHPFVASGVIVALGSAVYKLLV